MVYYQTNNQHAGAVVKPSGQIRLSWHMGFRHAGRGGPRAGEALVGL
jgi:hypothetical protein